MPLNSLNNKDKIWTVSTLVSIRTHDSLTGRRNVQETMLDSLNKKDITLHAKKSNSLAHQVLPAVKRSAGDDASGLAGRAARDTVGLLLRAAVNELQDGPPPPGGVAIVVRVTEVLLTGTLTFKVIRVDGRSPLARSYVLYGLICVLSPSGYLYTVGLYHF